MRSENMHTFTAHKNWGSKHINQQLVNTKLNTKQHIGNSESRHSMSKSILMGSQTMQNNKRAADDSLEGKKQNPNESLSAICCSSFANGFCFALSSLALLFPVLHLLFTSCLISLT